MSGRLVLSTSVLVENLIAEMRDAMAAMQAGDYDSAYATLEGRVEPNNAMQRPPRALTLPSARVGKLIFDLAPEGVLRDDHGFFVEQAASVIAQVLDRDTSTMDIDKLAVAANFAEDCGLSLQWEASEDEAG